MHYPTYQKLKSYFNAYEREQIYYILKTASSQGSAYLQLLELFQSMLIEARGFDDPMALARMIYTYKDKFLKTHMIEEQRAHERSIKNKSTIIYDKSTTSPSE